MEVCHELNARVPGSIKLGMIRSPNFSLTQHPTQTNPHRAHTSPTRPPLPARPQPAARTPTQRRWGDRRPPQHTHTRHRGACSRQAAAPHLPACLRGGTAGTRAAPTSPPRPSITEPSAHLPPRAHRAEGCSCSSSSGRRSSYPTFMAAVCDLAAATSPSGSAAGRRAMRTPAAARQNAIDQSRRTAVASTPFASAGEAHPIRAHLFLAPA